jgi:thymidine kinase
MSGYLEIIIGPMFSGKSTEIIRKIRLLRLIDNKILVIKPLIDNRYLTDKITSHNYESVDCIVVNNLSEIDENIIKNLDAIVIDEGQFFNDLFCIVKKWLNTYNIKIIIAGLDGDFQQNPIGEILKLIPLSNKCIKLNSLCNICKDGTKAPFSFRLDESKSSILVGGSDKYIPLCRKHYGLFNTVGNQYNLIEIQKNVQMNNF